MASRTQQDRTRAVSNGLRSDDLERKNSAGRRSASSGRDSSGRRDTTTTTRTTQPRRSHPSQGRATADAADDDVDTISQSSLALSATSGDGRHRNDARDRRDDELSIGQLSSVTQSRNTSLVDQNEFAAGFSTSSVPRPRRGQAIQSVPPHASSRYDAVSQLVAQYDHINVSAFSEILAKCFVRVAEDDVYEQWAQVIDHDSNVAYAAPNRVIKMVLDLGGCVLRNAPSETSGASLHPTTMTATTTTQHSGSAAENNTHPRSGRATSATRDAATTQQSDQQQRGGGGVVRTHSSSSARDGHMMRALSPESANRRLAQRHLSPAKRPAKPPMIFGTTPSSHHLSATSGVSRHDHHLRRAASATSQSPERTNYASRGGGAGGESPSNYRAGFSPSKKSQAEIDRIVRHMYDRGIRRKQERELNARRELQQREERELSLLRDPNINPRSRHLSSRYMPEMAVLERDRFTRPTTSSFRRDDERGREISQMLTRRRRSSPIVGVSPSRLNTGESTTERSTPMWRSRSNTPRPEERHHQDASPRRAQSAERSTRRGYVDPECTFAPSINHYSPSPRPSRMPTGFYEAVTRVRQTPPRRPSPSQRFEESLRSSTPTHTVVDTRAPSTFGYERLAKPEIDQFSVEALAEPVHLGAHGTRQVRNSGKLDQAIQHAVSILEHVFGGRDHLPNDVTALETSAFQGNSDFVPLRATSKKMILDAIDEKRLRPEDAALAKAALDTLQLGSLVRNHSRDIIEASHGRMRHVSAVRRRIAPTEQERSRAITPHYAMPLRRSSRPPVTF